MLHVHVPRICILLWLLALIEEEFLKLTMFSPQKTPKPKKQKTKKSKYNKIKNKNKTIKSKNT